MRRLDLIILVIGIVLSITWVITSSKDGFKGNNATIVARSITMTATIDGQIKNAPPVAGTRVDLHAPLVEIFNARIDQSRLAEFESEIEYLHLEISNLLLQEQQLAELLSGYKIRSEAHSAWMRQDVKLKNAELNNQLKIAEKTKKLHEDGLNRVAKLYKLDHSSNASLTAAQTEADIASLQVELNKSILQRNRLLDQAITNNSMFFDNGDTGYWEKMIDTLTLRNLDNQAQMSSLRAQLARAQIQVDAERERLGSNFKEQHNAPFSGLVNATYVSKGTHVNVGTSLLEVLDCANPIVIVPIPIYRISDFSVGMKVTVYPVDSDEQLEGSIKYMSSGPLIGHDQTLLLQQEVVLGDIHAVVNLSPNPDFKQPSFDCENVHKAVVVIHTDSLYGKAVKWFADIFTTNPSNDAELLRRIAAADEYSTQD